MLKHTRDALGVVASSQSSWSRWLGCRLPCRSILEEPAPPPVPRITSEAQIAPGRWDVERVRCSDLLGAADEDRESAAMFYYGYLAAKAGIHVIDVSQIDGNVRKVMDRCAATPNITVPQAFRQALGRRG